MEGRGILAICILIIVDAFDDNIENKYHRDQPSQPLGSHLTPTPVNEIYVNETDIKNLIPTFLSDYLVPKKTLLVKGETKTWRSYTNWTDEYLKERYGHLHFRLGGKKSNETRRMPPHGDVCVGRDSLKHFLDTYDGKAGVKYIDSQLPTPMYEDVALPTLLGCEALLNSVIEVDMWISSGPVHTELRKHSFNVWACQLNGTNQFKLIDNKYDHLMYEIFQSDNQRQENTQYSHVDGMRVNLTTFPELSSLPTMQISHVHQGDCLFIPSGTWYMVASEGQKNVALRFVFDNFNSSDAVKMEKCDKEAKSNIPLTEIDPDWNYKGEGRLSMGNSPLSHYLDLMATTLFSTWDNTLKYENIFLLLQYTYQHLPYSDQHSKPKAIGLHEMLEQYTTKAQPVFIKSMLSLLSREKLREIANEYLQAPVLENSCDIEYSFFSPYTIQDMLVNISQDNNGMVAKEQVFSRYMRMGGHLMGAEHIWQAIRDDGEEEIGFQDNRWKLDEGLEKFYLFHWEDEDEESDLEGHLEEDEQETDLDIDVGMDPVTESSEENIYRKVEL